MPPIRFPAEMRKANPRINQCRLFLAWVLAGLFVQAGVRAGESSETSGPSTKQERSALPADSLGTVVVNGGTAVTVARTRLPGFGKDLVRLAWPGQPATGRDPVFRVEESATLANPAAWLEAREATGLPDGVSPYHYEVGTGTRFFRLRVLADLPSGPFRIERTSPGDEESEVALSRRVEVELSQPLVAGQGLAEDALRAFVAEQPLAGRLELSADRRVVSLRADSPWPPASRVNVMVRAGAFRDATGRPLADLAASPSFSFSFNTCDLFEAEHTGLIGRVVSAADGRGIPGVGVTVDGWDPQYSTTTGTDGSFRLNPAPAGRYFLAIDGRTAPGVSGDGSGLYPRVLVKSEALAGVETNQVGASGVIALPLLTDEWRRVDPAVETRIVPAPASLRSHPELDGLELVVPPGTTQGRIGVSAAVTETLAGGVTPAVIARIDSDSGADFERLVAVTLPNLPIPSGGAARSGRAMQSIRDGLIPGLAPGAKSALLTRDPRTGRWEIVGTMTVSPDGKVLRSDAGVGIRRPGLVAAAPVFAVRFSSVRYVPPTFGEDDPLLTLPPPAETRVFGPLTGDTNRTTTGTARREQCERSWLAHRLGLDRLVEGNYARGTARPGDLIFLNPKEEYRLWISSCLGLEWKKVAGGVGTIVTEDDATPVFFTQPANNAPGRRPIDVPPDEAETEDPDTDQDGLQDWVETILGTNPQMPDSDGDGVTDAVARDFVGTLRSSVRGDAGAVGGVSSRLEFRFPARVVDAANDLLAVGYGRHLERGAFPTGGELGGGVAFFDLSPVSGRPVPLGTLSFYPEPTSLAVGNEWVAVARFENGMAIVDTRDRRNPVLRWETALPGFCDLVTAAGRFVIGSSAEYDPNAEYGMGPKRFLTVVDAWFGQVVSGIELPARFGETAFSGITVFHDLVFVADATTVSSYRLDRGALAFVDRATNPFWDATSPIPPRLVVDGRFVYLTGMRNGVVAISHTEGHFRALGAVRHLFEPEPQFWSGGQVSIGSLGALSEGQPIALLLAPLRLPDREAVIAGLAKVPGFNPLDPLEWSEASGIESLALYNGVAYVPGRYRTGGAVQVLPFPQGSIFQAGPQARLRPGFPTDLVSGGRVIGGEQAWVEVEATGESGIARVELFHEGRRFLVDGSYPYEFRFSAPAVAQGATASFELRAKAVDRRGRIAWTDPVRVTVVPPDQPLAPPVYRYLPGSADTRLVNVDERPLQLASGASDRVEARRVLPDGSLEPVVYPGRVLVSADHRTTGLDLGTGLPSGSYRVTLPDALTDLKSHRWAEATVEVVIPYAPVGDADFDGIPDLVEPGLGLDAQRGDTDGNGIPDGLEDADRDGLTYRDERRLGTDPLRRDSDGDGVSDADEDPDGDQLTNLSELMAGTNPVVPDSDGDGYDDGAERLAGLDPRNSASRPAQMILSEAISYLNAVNEELPSGIGAVWSATVSYLNALPTDGPAGATHYSPVVSYLNH